MRLFLIIASLLVLGFGIGCLNYTLDGKAEHHREWALEKGVPQPSEQIFMLGVVGTTAGAWLAGFLIGRRPRT